MTDQQWQHARRVLVLDRVQDPGNLGTLLRNAEALSWDAVYLLDGCCDAFNEKAVRAARGAMFTVSVGKGTWEQFRTRAQPSSMLLLAAAPSQHCDSEALATASESIGQVFEDVRHGDEASHSREVNESGTAADEGPAANTLRHYSHVDSDSGGIESDLSSLFEQLESRKVALVLGSEGQGLRPEILKDCRTVSIPMIGQTESLNVAAAGSMLMLVLSQSLKGVLQHVHGAMNA
jgi:RNA methyltransferase, TrmH family